MRDFLPIVKFPHPALRARARPVTEFDSALRTLVADLLAAMYYAPGIGLAAPQVGVLQRVAVVDLGLESGMAEPLHLINPEITWRSDELANTEEGCLSLPEVSEEIKRPAAIKFRHLDLQGQSHSQSAEGLLATCIQHEIDHLNGVLFIDYLTPLKRNMIERKLRKQKRLAEVL
ncbi:MAG: peptide deformylase [Alphaproteobacteria bacterium]|nr:peptide deformylase [Alphaproteobacteria bacterium]